MGFPITLSSEQSREFSNLVQKFYVFLPCADCRQHYKREVQNMNVNIRDKNTAMNVILHLHNQVRKRQRKNLFSQNDIINYHFNKSKGPIIPLWIFVAFLVILIVKYYIMPLTPG